MLSRVADSLYWMSRYLERAEHVARVIDVYLNRLLELSNQSDEARWNLMLASLHAEFPAKTPTGPQAELSVVPPASPAAELSRKAQASPAAEAPEQALEGREAELPPPAPVSPRSRVRALIFDPENGASLAYCIEKARENARQVREQISSEMWEQLNQLFLYVKKSSTGQRWHTEPHEFFTAVKQGSHLFQGIADSTMNHSEGWDFIQVGRFIERASSVAALLDAHYGAFAKSIDDSIKPDDYFDWVGMLKSCTAFEAYCKVYTANLSPYSMAEFLLLNPDFPHSIRFSVDMVQNAMASIAEATKTHRSGRANRLVGRLLAELNFGQIEEIMVQGVNAYLQDVQRQCAVIHSAFYQTYVFYPIDSSRLRLESG
jgi:uncharacterized alpha-E superfamily protein